MTSAKNLVFALVGSVLLSACEKEVLEPPERIRAVKTIVVAERASGQIRKFPGTVEPVDTSSISFEVSGLVQKIEVNVGDQVSRDQVLAVLDKKPFELNVESATAALSRTKAQLKEKKAAYDRQRRIQEQDPGATSQQAVDQAKAAYESVRQNVSYNQAQLDLARRDLAKTELLAPFDSVISARNVEPFEEVKRGQPVFDLFAEGAMQVLVQIPENMIDAVYVGLQSEIRFPTRPDRVYYGAVTEVGSAAEAANAFPVKATIGASDESIRPGMTAELTLLLSGSGDDAAYLVPISALAPGTGDAKWSVFVFDAGTSTVKKTTVTGKGLVGDQGMVTEGIEPGDIVAVAGVSFLRDGQKVKLLNPDQATR